MKNSMTKKNKMQTFDIINITFLAVISIFMIYPFYNVIIISFAKYDDLVQAGMYLIPKSFDLDAYKTVLSDSSFYKGFIVSVFITIVGTSISMILSVCGGYALSKKDMPGRNLFLFIILFTMFFSGGLIPYYLTVKAVGLIDTIWVMILPIAVSTWNLIIIKNYFNNFPASLEESARLDGANDIQILMKIVIPTSMPVIATFSLFYAVDRWNEWWNALIFVSDKDIRPLQIVLREILINYSSTISEAAKQALLTGDKVIFATSIQMAAIVVTMVPIIIVYPFLQKYFVKGIMIGSIKE
ncbi:carbohydrate ABC transporter permease [Paenibacillus sp. NRS-1760]|uniref:carbohydrate ABC transporter permease n=1 Tax=Paenibacillus sp. NRS-1760 TaxID=3233902 RepID=UPI003D2AEA3F